MACSNINLLVNGGFRQGLSPWSGSNIKRVDNPIYPDDYSILMGAQNRFRQSILKQTIRGPFEQGCAYYLYFRVLNQTVSTKPFNLFATVAYLDAGRAIIRSTPLLIQPPKATAPRWFSYFTIVPPPPPQAKYANIAFLLEKGTLYVDYIYFASRSV